MRTKLLLIQEPDASASYREWGFPSPLPNELVVQCAILMTP